MLVRLEGVVITRAMLQSYSLLISARFLVESPTVQIITGLTSKPLQTES